MRIALVGGMDRQERHFRDLATAAGHDLDVHDGHVGGRGSSDLDAIVQRSDLVVILTDKNSHGAVGIAKRAVQRWGRASLILRRCGIARFHTLLEAIDARAEVLAFDL